METPDSLLMTILVDASTVTSSADDALIDIASGAVVSGELTSGVATSSLVLSVMVTSASQVMFAR